MTERVNISDHPHCSLPAVCTDCGGEFGDPNCPNCSPVIKKAHRAPWWRFGR